VFLRECLEDGIQFVGKAEVKHLVSFVENYGLYGIKLERAAINVIKGSTWRGNNDMRAVLTPTRELCLQVSESFHSYGRDAGIIVTPIYGGRHV